jgi:uncharacterized protein involved in exopolysaccharide biosynthesis
MTEERSHRELSPADYLAMFRRRWVLIVVLAVIGAPLAYGVSRFFPNRFKSQTLVMVEPPNVSTSLVPQFDMTSISQRLSGMQQEILSRTRLEPIVRQYGLYANEINQKPMEDLVGQLQKAVEVTPVQPMAETGARDLPGFSVGVTLDNPRTAQAVCTAITSMFIEENLARQEQHSTQTTQFLAQQLDEAKTNLDAQDAKLATFKSQHAGSLPDDEQTNLNLLTGLTSQLDATNQALARAQQDKSFAESMLTQQISAWQASAGGHDPDTVQQQLAAMRAELSGLQSRYTDDYPDVIKAKAAVAALEKKLADSQDSTKPASEPGPKASVEPAQITQWRAQVHGSVASRNRSENRSDSIKAAFKRVPWSRNNIRN